MYRQTNDEILKKSDIPHTCISKFFTAALKDFLSLRDCIENNSYTAIGREMDQKAAEK